MVPPSIWTPESSTALCCFGDGDLRSLGDELESQLPRFLLEGESFGERYLGAWCKRCVRELHRIARSCAELRAAHLRERPRGLSVALRQRVERRHRLLAPVQAEQTVRRSTLAEKALRA